MKILLRCKQCYFPSTKPDLHFDKDGVCHACHFTEHAKKIDWDARRVEFLEFCDKLKSKSKGLSYDCIIPVSGGKDSTYQVHLATKIGGLNPLLVSFEPSCPTEVGEKNLKNMVEVYNCDLIQLRKSPTYKKLAKIGFDVVGDHEWPNHVGIYCWPLQVAVNYNLPDVMYGELQGYIGLGRWDEITSQTKFTRESVEQYIGMNGLRVSDMMDFDDTIRKSDVVPYIYPPVSDIERAGVTAHSMGYFFHWDFEHNRRIIKDEGWLAASEVPDGSFTNFEDIDCGFMPMHQYFKFIKYGYGRATDHASYEIRHGRMTKKEAKELIIEYDGKIPRQNFQEFLDFLDINESYFFDTVDRFANPGIFKTDGQGKFIRSWDDNLIRNEDWYKSFDT